MVDLGVTVVVYLVTEIRHAGGGDGGGLPFGLRTREALRFTIENRPQLLPFSCKWETKNAYYGLRKRP